MAKKKNLMDYIDVYLESCFIHEECTMNGNYKEGNRAYKKIDKIFNLAKESNEKERFYIQIFKSTENVNALTWCCMHMLKLGIDQDIARLKLKEISEDVKVHPLLRSNAKLTLQEWDKGNIKPVV